MKVVIPGGSGQVGTILARAFYKDGHEVIILSRRPEKTRWRSISWDAETLGDWVSELDGADVIINLTGRNVNCRYNTQNRVAIMESRVNSTRLVGKAISQVNRPPRIWLQASTATIYAHRFDAPNDEKTGILGGSEADAPKKWRFSIEVAKAWEKAVDEADVPNTRKVKMRSAMIMSPDNGGIFDTLLRLVRFGLGGKAGSGRQYVSWIHQSDFIRSIYWLIESHQVEGIVNLSSPNPLPYADFMRNLRVAWGMPIGLPATRWMLEIGSFFLRTETELVLKSRRVVPGRLIENGFAFVFPEWPEAAQDLVEQWQLRKLPDPSTS